MSKPVSKTFGVVTTCSQQGWGEYGSKMVNGFLKHFPEDVRLYLYVDFKKPIAHERVIVRSIPELCADLVAFQDETARFDFARGERVCHSGHEVAYDASLIWNARKFSFKVFVVEHAVLNAAEDVMIWLDADSVAFDDVPLELLDATIPADCMIGYLGRSWKYSECGYVAYNTARPLTRRFVSSVAGMYRTGAIYSLKEWHDSYVFDVVRREFETRLGARSFNISKDVADIDHVFVNSEIGRHVDHLKGGRKADGHSRPGDVVRHADVAYWATVAGSAVTTAAAEANEREATGAQE